MLRLVCHNCGTWEWRREWVTFDGCPLCGDARYAENENGEPLVLISCSTDIESWDTDPQTGAVELT